MLLHSLPYYTELYILALLLERLCLLGISVAAAILIPTDMVFQLRFYFGDKYHNSAATGTYSRLVSTRINPGVFN